MTKNEYEKLFAKLDYDGNETINLNEMHKFVIDCFNRNEILLISIVWVGHVLDPRYEEHLNFIKEICLPRLEEPW